MALTNKGLVEHAKNVLKLDTVYILGTLGQPLSEKLINTKCNAISYNANRKETLVHALKMGTDYAFDCSGLIKSYLYGWSKGKYTYNSKYDLNADTMYSKAKKKGAIKDMPKDVVGLIVYMKGHVGIYIGNGEVIECTPSTTYARQSHHGGGVCKTALNKRKWTHYFYEPNISYGTAKKSITTIAKEVIDGKWGSGTERKNKLTKEGYDYDKVQAKVNELLAKK